MSIQDQIALLRGAVAVPKEPSEAVADAALKAWIEHPGDGAPRDWFVCAMRAGNAATPPAYAEALAAVIEGYEAMQRTLESIAAADPSKWDEEMRDQFQPWAQNRARHTLAKLGEKA